MVWTVQHGDYGEDWCRLTCAVEVQPGLSSSVLLWPDSAPHYSCPDLPSVPCQQHLVSLVLWGCAGVRRSLHMSKGRMPSQGSQGAAHFSGMSRWKGSCPACSHAPGCLLSQEAGLVRGFSSQENLLNREERLNLPR